MIGVLLLQGIFFPYYIWPGIKLLIHLDPNYDQALNFAAYWHTHVRRTNMQLGTSLGKGRS